MSFAAAHRPARGLRALDVKGWLQERQYATPYHWRQRPNDELEYRLRTQVVFELARLGGSQEQDPPFRPPNAGPAVSDGARPSLLDIGCGDARFAAAAARRAHVFGVDISRRALSHARGLVPAANFAASSAAALPFASDRFDVVTLLDVIEHIPDAAEPHVIQESVRVLRPGGRLVISTNTDRSACELKHYRHYSLVRFRSLFAGLDAVQLRGLIPYFPTLKIWMAAPLVWRITRSRIRTCAPDRAHVIVGSAIKPIIG
jgi:SAM-dependent methyltransferase